MIIVEESRKSENFHLLACVGSDDRAFDVGIMTMDSFGMAGATPH